MADIQPAGSCEKCQGASVTCKHNHFEQEDLWIHSWEHKCPDCGDRNTVAFRSDEPDTLTEEDPTKCPYCGRDASP